MATTQRYCTNCGTLINDTKNNYCPHCGARIAYNSPSASNGDDSCNKTETKPKSGTGLIIGGSILTVVVPLICYLLNVLYMDYRKQAFAVLTIPILSILFKLIAIVCAIIGIILLIVGIVRAIKRKKQ